ncbi:acyl carrier protein [Enterobacter pseudoroggenkampii]|uniref:acyl carrier protein n=1 Tax=Enterobacter pseudoroggenkampii TaxID=2996112 RepID=UPI0025B19A1F|nr:acyl carrier protein [Enterobacter pseudoroggenkampii]WJW96708.1 acyl carrier protein [Enterobacter pseudoroggenkampii]
MEPNEFIDFLNQKTGMNLKHDQVDTDLTQIAEWDSLTFVYTIMELEFRNSITLNVEKILKCNNLRKILKVVNDEIQKN